MNAPASSSSIVWSMAGGGPQRTGRFDGVLNLAATPERTLRARAAVLAPVVLDGNDRVFVADMAGAVRAYSSTGQRLWEQIVAGGVAAAPAVDPAIGRLFVGTLTGSIHALDTRSGLTAWRVNLPSSGDPRILADLLVLPHRGLVITSSWGGRFCAVSTESGETRFTWDAGLFPRAGVCADREGNLYCLRALRDEGVQLVRVDPEGVEVILHRAPTGSRGPARALVTAAPVLDEPRGRLYALVNDGRAGELCAWSLAERQVLWRVPFERSVAATPSVRSDGTVLVADMNGCLQAIGPDGSPRFQCRTGCEYLLAPPVCDTRGQAFVSDPTGAVHVVELGGECRRFFEAPRALQAQASFDGQGRFYVPCADHQVYVFRNLAAG